LRNPPLPPSLQGNDDETLADGYAEGNSVGLLLGEADGVAEGDDDGLVEGEAEGPDAGGGGRRRDAVIVQKASLRAA
jgi:hypothetical protein